MFFNKERSGAGGILFIGCSMALAMIFVLTITFIRLSTAKSVAESVEHTIALQCLASCYLHPNSYGEDNVWTDTTQKFDPITEGGNQIKPVDQFISTMKAYNLMSRGERGKTDGAADIKVAMRYIKHDSSNYSSNPSFEICVYNWSSYDSYWTHVFKIKPNPVKVVVEDAYKPNLNPGHPS